MTTITEPSVLSQELARIDALVARIDAAGLRHRLAMNEADRGAWYTELPAMREYLAYEAEAITAELTRRTSR